MTTVLCLLVVFVLFVVAACVCWHKFVLNLRDTRFIIRGAFELFRGFRVMQYVVNPVTAFGSARLKPGSPSYRRLHSFLSQLIETSKQRLLAAITVVTGGGPGAMEAGNRAGHDAGVETVGLNIILPFEQAANQYCSQVVNFFYFFTRKICLVRYSRVFIIGDGGFGTVDELYEVLTLQQTGKSPVTPIYVIDEAYAQQILDMCVGLLERRKIGGADLERITLVNCPNVPDIQVPWCEEGSDSPRSVSMRRLETDEEAIEEIMQVFLSEQGLTVGAAAPTPVRTTKVHA